MRLPSIAGSEKRANGKHAHEHAQRRADKKEVEADLVGSLGRADHMAGTALARARPACPPPISASDQHFQLACPLMLSQGRKLPLFKECSLHRVGSVSTGRTVVHFSTAIALQVYASIAQKLMVGTERYYEEASFPFSYLPLVTRSGLRLFRGRPF